MPIRKRPPTWGILKLGHRLDRGQIESRARMFLAQMSLGDKIRQMSGDQHLFPHGLIMLWAYNRTPIPAGENRQMDIPGIRFSDGPRGVVMYRATCFPVSMARGATWDTDLEERIGDAIGVEARSMGANFFGGVCINLLRHPAWGRAQETYGEDPHLLGEMGAALTRGVQRHIMACAKHYALNSIENARFKVDVQVDERTLHEVYLPHFKRCVDEGVAAIMSAYNKVNGEWCSHHHTLLRTILKEEWGFEGFVVSDFVYAVHDAKAAALGGLDVEMPFVNHFRRNLERLVQRGEVPEAVIDEAVLRILRMKVRFSQVGQPERYKKEAVLSEAHILLAREAARKSIVLLKNDPLPDGAPLLPLQRDMLKKVAVIGRLANLPNTGDHGSSQVHPPYVVTPLTGIRASAGAVEVLYDNGRDPVRAARTASGADAVLVVAGYTYKEEGEAFWRPFQPAQGGDRTSLRLTPADEALILAVAAANPRCAVALVGGSAIITEAWLEQVPAVLMAWYGGMEGGHALAEVLFGEANPSGKLPCTFPKSEAQLPFFDPDADAIEYGYYHGYQLFDKENEEAAFPFGFGLSYTQYKYSDLILDQSPLPPDGALQVSVQVHNRGSQAGEEIVQLYAGCLGRQVDHPVKALKGFQRVALAPGEARTVTFTLQAADLAYYDVECKIWVVEPAEYQVLVGGSSRQADLLRAVFQISAE